MHTLRTDGGHQPHTILTINVISNGICSFICPTTKVTVWLSENRTTVLRESHRIYGGIRIQNKPAQPLRRKEDGGQETAHSLLECRQPKDIMRGQTRGVKYDLMARVGVWVDERVMWKETQFTGDVAGLLVTRRSQNINGRVTKGNYR